MSAAAPTVGETLATTHGTWNGSPTGYTYQWQYSTNSGSTWSSIPSATSSSYVVTSTYLGDIIRVQVTATNAASESGVAYASATGVVTVSGGVAQEFFTPTDPFNDPIPGSPVLDSNNTTWQSKFTSMFASLDTSTLYGWPVYFATSADPVITVDGGYQNAKLHWPDGAVPSGDADGHLIVIAPGGATETEMGAATVSGTWPSQTVSLGNGYSPCQFVVSTSAGNTTRNICGDSTVDGNPSHTGSPGSARGCGISCLAGLVLQSEFAAGVIPHALCATCSWTASTFRSPAIISDGGTSGGIPEGARIQLDPAFDISGYTATQQIIAKALQVYGFYVTDSTGASGNAVVFESQATDGSNAAYAALDEQNGNTLGGLSMWAHMRVLNSWNGT